MNNYYWYEYIKYFVDTELKKKIQKFHLSTYSNIWKNKSLMPNRLYDEWNQQQKKINYPDTEISHIPFNRLSHELQQILNLLLNLANTYEIISFLPIISIQTNKKIYHNYGIDYEHSKLVLYSLYATNVLNENKCSYVISYFLNLDESILLYNTEAYIMTIMQIGYIKKSLEVMLKNNFILFDIMEQSQKWTHGLKINPLRELLIATTGIGVIQ